MKVVKEIGKRISDIALAGFIFLAIPAVIFLLVTSRTNLIFGIRSYVVESGSMRPTLPVGSIVFTEPKSDYQIGQIITFKRGNISVTHRIVGKKDGKFQTKGDANKEVDPQLVNKSDVIGKDIYILPYAGFITNFIKTVPGFLIVIVLPNVVFIGFEIWNIKEEYRKHIERKIMKELKSIV